MRHIRQILLVLGLVCAVAATAWIWWHAKGEARQPEAPLSQSHVAAEPRLSANHTETVAELQQRREERITKSQSTGERSTALDEYGAAHTTVAQDLKLVHELMLDYLLSMKTGEFPTGANEEIMRVLLGDNSRYIPFVPHDHPALNEQRELLDRFGTPLHFHALSAVQMELRSAGPDRKFYTVDDVVYPEAQSYGMAMP